MSNFKGLPGTTVKRTKRSAGKRAREMKRRFKKRSKVYTSPAKIVRVPRKDSEP